MNLAGATGLVTGAGKGIGRAIALMLAREGCTVVLTSRTQSDLESVRKEIVSRGGKAISVPADLTRDEEVEGLFERVRREIGRLDVLVNNAGMGRFAPVRDLTLDDLGSMWNLNMRSLVHCTKLALPLIESAGGGVIVNMASLAGKNAFVGGAGYAATKWAVIGFSRCLMLEVREKNIRVLTVCPGSVDTEFSGKAEPARASRILSPDDVAEATIAALKLPDRAMVSEIDIRPTRPV